MADPILIAQHGDVQCFILPGLANRHGLVTGATDAVALIANFFVTHAF